MHTSGAPICVSYWVQHLQKSDILPQLQDEVHQFFTKQFLHWLEGLAWLGRTSEAMLALISLDGQIEVSVVIGICLLFSFQEMRSNNIDGQRES